MDATAAINGHYVRLEDVMTRLFIAALAVLSKDVALPVGIQNLIGLA